MSSKSSRSARSPKRAHSGRGAKREVSAGGVVLHEGRVLVIVPTRRAADGSLVLGLPKGHLDGEETAEQAATREVLEETGVRAEMVAPIGEVRYWYVRHGQRISKSVHFFLFSYLAGDVADHDDEVLEARWLAVEQARDELTYPGERGMLDRALAIAAEDR